MALYELLINDRDIDDPNASPQLKKLRNAIQQIEVEDHARMADMLRLSVAVAARENGSGWNVLDDGIFEPLTNIKVKVNVGSGSTELLIDACVIETEVEFSNEPGRSTLRVVAMDPTVRMNLKEKIRPWPNRADSAIAAAIFSEYDFTPKVEQTQPTRQEKDNTVIQRGTDIQFLRQLAGRNGYECYVEADPGDGPPVAHFHRPCLEHSVQDELTVNMGPFTNVDRFKARYDALLPTAVTATGLDVKSHSEQPVQVENTALRTLGSTSVLSSKRLRRILLSRTGLSQAGELQTYAQAVVDQSAWAITAEGELSTWAYGRVLRAKRPVEVLGAGLQFSGTYYVERVHHTISGGGSSYTQRFTLRRNALGVTGGERFSENGSLA